MSFSSFQSHPHRSDLFGRSLQEELSQGFLGPLLIGSFLHNILYGVVILQIIQYFTNQRSHDPLAMRLFVAVIFVLSTLGIISSQLSTYQTALAPYSDLEYSMSSVIQMTRLRPPMAIVLGVDSLAGLAAQIFYAYRIFKLSKALVIPIVVCILGGFQSALLLNYAVEFGAWSKGEYAYVDGIGAGPSLLAWAALGPVIDSLMSLTQIYWLRRLRTGFEATDRFFTQSSRLILQTGLVTSLVALAELIVLLRDNQDRFFLMLLMPLSCIYFLCVMSHLNGRMLPDGSVLVRQTNPVARQLKLTERKAGSAKQGKEGNATSDSRSHTKNVSQFTGPCVIDLEASSV